MTNTNVSPRALAVTELVGFLQEHASVFNAPYGVLSSLDLLPKGGRVRTVTFGCAATLDATVQVWSPTRLTVSARGPAGRSLHNRSFTSVAELTRFLAQQFCL